MENKILKNLETVKSNHPFKEYCRKFIKDNFGKMSQREIARKLNIGKTTVNNWARLLGLAFHKDTANDKYFEFWSSEMAYIFGYISADGNVSWNVQKGYYSVTITAAEKDKEHLEILRQLLQSTKPLLYAISTKSYRLIINSKEMCRDLMGLGIVPRKSLILQFPDVPNEFLKDYIRGYIDGDGSLRYFNRPRSPYFELMICSGSEKFIKALEKQIYLKLDIHANITKTSCFLIRYSCKRGLKLAQWLYDDRSLYLKRKFNKYELALRSRKDLAP